ncbi:sigma-70 family RNA polymerase sigma factor [Paraflavitalea soli]|uniref:Sigma-70 family RNA polymerase sigma factor n=1 Tax=Paraflavitalea soli TaxID=2315862 RepID=A0A3B7MSL3_9BACT|nr:sigma-70 family RNA polymerase sigma factor [Paraflavitalea soli]AXY76847.1 sigma-70 family RNA polymerase sigma factor [Paraflavitalea soli]
MAPQQRKEAFTEQIAGNEALIWKICRLYGHTAEDRQDLFQEIMVQTWQSFDQFRGEAKFSTWLYQVALNTAIAGIRKKKRTIPIVQREAIPEMADHSPPADDEQLQQLYTAITKLNGIEKALTLLYLEDKSYKEMETILGINESTLRVKMTRVKEKLRQLLNAYTYGTR